VDEHLWGNASRWRTAVVSATELLRNVRRSPELFHSLGVTPSALRVITRYLNIGEPPYPVEVPLRKGGVLTLLSRGEVKVFWQIAVRKSYALPSHCSTILDCGANVGIFTVWAAAERPDARIVAVEPCRETFDRLTGHIDANRLTSRVQCLRVGLAAQTAERFLDSAYDTPNRRLIPADAVPARPHAAESVTCVTLEDCMQGAGISELDLLKMDIEGSEWEVLLSTPPAVLSRIQHVQLEYHQVHRRFNHRPQQLFDHLARAGHCLTYREEDRFETGLAFFERRI
jgi:FkbM family methyltransferase